MHIPETDTETKTHISVYTEQKKPLRHFSRVASRALHEPRPTSQNMISIPNPLISLQEDFSISSARVGAGQHPHPRSAHTHPPCAPPRVEAQHYRSKTGLQCPPSIFMHIRCSAGTAPFPTPRHLTDIFQRRSSTDHFLSFVPLRTDMEEDIFTDHLQTHNLQHVSTTMCGPCSHNHNPKDQMIP